MPRAKSLNFSKLNAELFAADAAIDPLLAAAKITEPLDFAGCTGAAFEADRHAGAPAAVDGAAVVRPESLSRCNRFKSARSSAAT